MKPRQIGTALVDHMVSARKFFRIRAARDWLFRQAHA